MRLELRFLGLGLSMGFVLSLAACGSSNQTPTTNNTAAITASNLTSYCQSKGGAVVSVSGTSYCKLEIPVKSSIALSYSGGNPGTASGLPVLTPSNPSGSTALNVGFQVMPGDRLYFSGAAQWGAIQIDSSSALWGLFNFTTITSNCSLANANGITSSGSTLPQNGGINQGLVVSDQSQVYFLGGNGNVSLKNSGNLMLGVNVPGTNMGCGSIQIYSMSVDRCLDGSGGSHSCS